MRLKSEHVRDGKLAGFLWRYHSITGRRDRCAPDAGVSRDRVQTKEKRDLNSAIGMDFIALSSSLIELIQTVLEQGSEKSCRWFASCHHPVHKMHGQVAQLPAFDDPDA